MGYFDPINTVFDNKIHNIRCDLSDIPVLPKNITARVVRTLIRGKEVASEAVLAEISLRPPGKSFLVTIQQDFFLGCKVSKKCLIYI